MALVKAKICGLCNAEGVEAALEGGAAYVGFVFIARSPRKLLVEAASDLASLVPPGVSKVALTVDAQDAVLDDILDRVPIDMLQLHGSESPDRVREIKARFGLPVMKAIGIADAPDLEAIETYSGVADQLLIDARPPRGAALPGGNGLSFDWRLIAGRRWSVPWMLAGGLTPENVAEAISLTGAARVDVSSGVETAPGVKDTARITDFLRAI